MSKRQIRSYDDRTFLDAIKPASEPHFKEARELARQMCHSLFEQPNLYPYVYFTDGATGAINSLIPKFSSVNIQLNEYRYVKCFEHVAENSTYADADYFSYPFSGTGNFETIPSKQRIILDCSYMFASNMKCKKIPVTVDYAIFSLSKSHNLSTLRCGWFFSKYIVPEFHILQEKLEYGSGIHVAALREVSKHPANLLYLSHQHAYTELYKKVGAIEGATNLFGVLSGDRIPYYMIS